MYSTVSFTLILVTTCKFRFEVNTGKTGYTNTPGAAIFSLHTLASPSGRNVNYDEKQLTGKKKFQFLLSVQVL